MRNVICFLMIMFVGSGCAVYHPHVTPSVTQAPTRKVDPESAQVLVPNDYTLFRELRNRGVNAYRTSDTPELRLLMDESERIVTTGYLQKGTGVGALANILIGGGSLFLIPTWSTWPASGNYVVKKLNGEVEADKTFHIKSKLWFWLPLLPAAFSREYNADQMEDSQRQRLAAAAADALAPILERKDDRSKPGREAWRREPLTTRVEVFNAEKLIQGFARLRPGMTVSDVGNNIGSSLAALVYPLSTGHGKGTHVGTGNADDILSKLVMGGDNIFLFTLEGRTSAALFKNAGAPVPAIPRQVANFRTRATYNYRFGHGSVGPDKIRYFLRDGATAVAGLRIRFDSTGKMEKATWLEHPDRLAEQY